MRSPRNPESESHNEPGRIQYAPTESDSELKSPSQTVGSIIRGFKAAVTSKINTLRNTPGGKVWQRNYYEHIIRNERDLYNIKNYIEMNPIKWEYDKYYL